MAADLVAVAAAVAFYHAHPQHRVELTSHAAARRIAAGDLPTPWADVRRS